MIAGIALSDSRSFFSSEWFGYLVMLVALTFIFVGVKRHRDVERGGVIKFGPAFAMGLGIAAAAGAASPRCCCATRRFCPQRAEARHRGLGLDTTISMLSSAASKMICASPRSSCCRT